uniref:Uncharacterized protein n=1 Tax=Romanomermis culicivorax TaxID=13658 RepID=A0A915KFE5_ROMCU
MVKMQKSPSFNPWATSTMQARAELFKDEKVDKCLINFIDLRLELHRNTNKFLLQCFDSNAKDLKLENVRTPTPPKMTLACLLMTESKKFIREVRKENSMEDINKLWRVEITMVTIVVVVYCKR